MKKYIKYVSLIILLVALIRILFILINYKNIYYEKEDSITGTIVSINKTGDKTTFDIKSKGKYKVSYYKENNYKLGDKVAVYGTFYNASSNTIPNGFDYNKYLLSKNIKTCVKASNIKLVSNNKNLLYKIKNKMIKKISKYNSKTYLKTFLMGDTSLIEDDIKYSCQSIGISHLLAVSGMHVGTFLLVLNFLLKKIKHKNIFIIMFLLFFLFITNYTESLMRCSLFIILNMINKKFKLNISSINLIILTASLLLIYNPYLIYSAGFLFSVMITFFILLSSKYINKYKNYFIKLFIMSIICFVATIPILSSFFFKINLLSPIYNLIFVPFVSIILFPLSIITFILPFLDNIYLFIISVFENLSLLLSELTFFTIIISKPPSIIIIIYYVILYLTFRVNKKFIVIFLIMIIININSRFFIRNPEVMFMDVGQGDSTIIILPKGHVIMIDTGGKMMSDYSIAKKQTIPYLNSVGINKIDCLILTHGDYDHMGEATNLIDNIYVKDIIINNGSINKNESKVIKKHKVINTKNKYAIDNYVFYFLNNKDYGEENKNSIVIYLNINNNNLLFMGDADKQTETDIINEYNLPNMDILKVGHHGSKTSSGDDFITAVSPKYSIISVGKDNKFGHPNKEALSALSNSKILRTDELGSIKFVFRKNMVNKFFCKPYIIVER